MNFKKSVLTVLFSAIGIFLIASSVQAGVTLADNVETGMELTEVERHLDLDHRMSDKGLAAYQKGDKAVYYFFNEETKELIYKLFQMEGKKSKYEDKYREMCDTVIKRPGAIFYSKRGSDFGIKILDNDTSDDEWQLWMGSIELWNDYSEDRSSMNPFQK